MNNTKQVLQELKTVDLNEILHVLEINFQKELSLEDFYGEGQTTWSLFNGLNYETPDAKNQLLTYVETLTDTNNIRTAYATIFEELEARKTKPTKEAERPKAQDQTTPANREDLEKERLIRETSEKEAWARSKEDVERARQKLEEIQLEKDKKLHVKVTPKEEVVLNTKEQEAYEAYKEYAKMAPPEEIIEELAQEIEARVGENLKSEGLSEEEIKVVTKGTATEIIENLKQADNPDYVPTSYQTAVLASVNKNPEVIKKVVGNETAQKLVQESSNNVATTHLLQYQMYKDITRSAFGENFANKVFGVDADKVEVTFSETPQAGGMTFTPYEVVRSNNAILEERSQTLDTVREFGADHAKGFLLKRAGGVLERRIALLTPQSAAGKLLQSVEAKSLLFSTFGVGTPIKWEATNLIGRLALKVAPDYAIPIISGIGKATGINFGITGSVSTGVKVASSKVAGQVSGQLAGKTAGQAIGKVVATTAVKTGLAATLSATFAAAGSWLPIIGNIIGAAVGWLVGKIFENPKVKKFFKEVLGPLLLVGGGMMFGAPVLGLAAGGLAFGFARGATFAGIGVGIWGFFGAIGSAFVVTIATPIIVTLLVLPPLVAFIMLVINNSAYMVPPDSEYSRPPLPGPIPGGGLVSACTETEETGPEITDSLAARIQNGVVNLLPETVWGRRDGICIKPTMIIMHWSGGANDDPDGNLRTYETLVQRGLSCQLATDTNDTWLMEKFFEKEVEFPACAKQWNTYSINNEMAGSYFLETPPPPNLEELELAYDATCKVMEQYDIPWSQIYGHYHVPNSGKIDPGRDFLEKVFIPEIKNRCPNEQNEPPTI